MRGQLLLLFWLLLGPGCLAADPELSSAQQGIINGQLSPPRFLPAIGALVTPAASGYRVVCTGTLIARSTVLSAAHCLAVIAPDAELLYFFGNDLEGPDASTKLIPILKKLPHPLFDGSSYPQTLADFRDIALFELARPLAVTPLPLIRPDEVDRLLSYDDALLVVGYGQTNAPDRQSAGIKMHGTTALAALGSSELWLEGGLLAQKCHGDSGGPTLADADPGPGLDWRVIGVASRGNTACTNGSIETRVDSYLEWLQANAPLPCGSGLNPPCQPLPPPPAPYALPLQPLQGVVPAAEAGLPPEPQPEGGCAVGQTAAPPPLLLGLLLLLLGASRGRGRSAALVATLAALLLAPAPLAAAPLGPLAPAWSLYQQGDGDGAARLAAALLPSLSAPQELREAHLVLAATAHLRGDQAAATEQLIAALSHDPGYQPDPLKLPPDLQALVREVARQQAAEIQERAARLAAGRRRSNQQASQPPSSSSSAQAPASVPAVSQTPRAPTTAQTGGSTPLLLALLPFGVGQFANGQPRKGWALLGSEAALLAASISCLAGALSLRTSSGRYLAGDLELARGLNIAYLTSAYAALGLIIYGAVDGVLNRHPQRGAAAGQVTRSRRTLILTGAGELGLGVTLAF